MREEGRNDNNKGNVGSNYWFTIVTNPFTIWLFGEPNAGKLKPLYRAVGAWHHKWSSVYIHPADKNNTQHYHHMIHVSHPHDCLLEKQMKHCSFQKMAVVTFLTKSLDRCSWWKFSSNCKTASKMSCSICHGQLIWIQRCYFIFTGLSHNVEQTLQLTQVLFLGDMIEIHNNLSTIPVSCDHHWSGL